jgi:hypothetical protein
MIRFAVLLVAVISLGAHAQNPCMVVSDMAKAMMTNRQAGVPLSEIIAKMDADKEMPESVRTMMTSIVMAAYDEPKFNSPDNQQEAINEFSSAMMLQCMKELGE